jgi:uncharacterized protein (TIGR00369 family)
MKIYADINDPRIPSELQFELEKWIEPSPFEQLLGSSIEYASEGQATLSLPFTVKLANGGGVMHGGAMTTLADTAVAMAIKSLLPPGTQFATTDLVMKFIAPVVSGTVTAHARVESDDDHVYHGECELRGEMDQLYATFTSIFKIVHK